MARTTSHFQPYLNQRCKANIYYDRSDTSKSENVFPFQRKLLTNTPDHFLLQFPSISSGFAKYFPMCRHNGSFRNSQSQCFTSSLNNIQDAIWTRDRSGNTKTCRLSMCVRRCSSRSPESSRFYSDLSRSRTKL